MRYGALGAIIVRSPDISRTFPLSAGLGSRRSSLATRYRYRHGLVGLNGFRGARLGQFDPTAFLIDNGDGTFTDPNTGQIVDAGGTPIDVTPPPDYVPPDVLPPDYVPPPQDFSLGVEPLSPPVLDPLSPDAISNDYAASNDFSFSTDAATGQPSLTIATPDGFAVSGNVADLTTDPAGRLVMPDGTRVIPDSQGGGLVSADGRIHFSDGSLYNPAGGGSLRIASTGQVIPGSTRISVPGQPAGLTLEQGLNEAARVVLAGSRLAVASGNLGLATRNALAQGGLVLPQYALGPGGAQATYGWINSNQYRTASGRVITPRQQTGIYFDPQTGTVVPSPYAGGGVGFGGLFSSPMILILVVGLLAFGHK